MWDALEFLDSPGFPSRSAIQSEIIAVFWLPSFPSSLHFSYAYYFEQFGTSQCDLDFIPAPLFVEFTGCGSTVDHVAFTGFPVAHPLSGGSKCVRFIELAPGPRFFVLCPRFRVQFPGDVPSVFLENLEILALGKFGFPIGLGLPSPRTRSFQERRGRGGSCSQCRDRPLERGDLELHPLHAVCEGCVL